MSLSGCKRAAPDGYPWQRLMVSSQTYYEFYFSLEDGKMSVSDSDDSGSLNSILHVRASELYPKKVLHEAQDAASIPLPFSPLCGEAVEFIGRITEGVLALSNYRLYYQRTGRDGKGDFSLPLGLIELVEVKELFHISINCKDARTYRCSFPSNDVCLDWMRRINKAMAPPKNIDELFAFVYYVWANEEGGEEISSCLGRDHASTTKDYFKSEYERMRFQSDSYNWRISSANADYKLCPSYPRQLIVPASFSDQALASCAKFRSSQRIPAVVWRHSENGAVLARSSQPEVGWFCWRSNDDEELLKLLSDCCASKNQIKPRLLVIDARSYTTAVANRARGGGCECLEYYSNIEILFMNLANIHYIRKSFQSLRQLCASPADTSTWHSTLENTKWLNHMALLLQAAVRAATALERDAQPVLVHCSDGWDRTTQIVSLTQILLDPYYRTFEGFQVLCEREWLDFGHKFADRCGIGEDPNEKCPVFLQWLDCIHNLMRQYKCAFEFSKRYLIKLAEHTYSHLFGTFLCNSSAERQKLGIAQRTFSVWRYLNASQFRNYLYNKDKDGVLWPNYNVRDLEVWRALYMDYNCDNQSYSDHNLRHGGTPPSMTVNVDRNSTAQDPESGSLNNLGNHVGSMLESAINCQPETGSDSGMGTNDEIENKSASTVHEDDEEKLIAVGYKLGGLVNGDGGGGGGDDDDDDDDASTNIGCLNLIDINNSNNKEASDVKEEAVAAVAAALNDTLRIVAGDNDDDDDDNVNCGEVEIAEKLLRKTESKEKAACNSRVNVVNVNGSCNGDEDEENVLNVNDGNDRPQEEDCDILCSDIKKTESGPDCNNLLVVPEDEDSELDIRLNGGDASVETSVETIVDSRCDAASSTVNDLFEYKTVTNGLRNYELSSCTQGRPQLALLDPIDGLPLIPDDVQDRLKQINIEHKAKLAAISNELHKTRFMLMTQICNQCTHQNVNPPDKQIVCEDDKGSVCSTEISWEAVDDKEVGGQVLWVPDYAANNCTSCQSRFWLGRRRHHCRGCGKIFCADCSRNVTSLPNEQLFDPVRVCENCYHTKRVSPTCLSYNMSPKQTTCKQAAAGEEAQKSSLMLPPASPI